jgi:hypothetical protein
VILGTWRATAVLVYFKRMKNETYMIDEKGLYVYSKEEDSKYVDLVYFKRMKKETCMI